MSDPLPLMLSPAGFFRRAAACLIDLLPVILLSAAIRVVHPAEFLLVAAIYHAAFRLRTLGRKAARVVILRCDGSDVGMVRAFLRTILYLLSALPMGLGFFCALWDKNGRTIHDRAAGTLAVRSPAGNPLKKFRIIGATAFLVVFAVACALTDAENRTMPFDDLPHRDIRPFPLLNGKLAMVAHMLTGSDQSAETWRTTLQRMKQMGVQVVEIGQIRWDEMEPHPGEYKWGYAGTVLRINREENLGLEFVADIGMFLNPGLDGIPRLPAHLDGKAFDDPAVIESLGQLYEEFLNLPGAESVTYLFQHFENAAAVVANRPDDVPRLQRLLRATFSRAKLMRPDLRTGVCIQRYEKPHFPATEIERWNVEVGTDVVPVISFGPGEFEPVGDISRTRAEFEVIASAAAGRPIALNECGYNSSDKTGSSPDTQAAFVREIFALLNDRHNQIEFATWYEYSDLDPIAATALGVYLATISGMPWGVGYFAENMGSCGLVTHGGEAKPAAEAWVEEAARYYRSRENAAGDHLSSPSTGASSQMQAP